MGIPIKKIKIRKLNMNLKTPFTTSFGTIQHKELFITEAVDEDGNRGYGESVAFSIPWYTEETVQTTLHMMEDFLIPLLQKYKNTIEHPDDLATIFKPVKRNNMAKSALEGAVWDLYAKRNDITLAEALGGNKKQVEAGISIGIQESVLDLLRLIEKSLADGYKRIKLKIKPEFDVEVLREVRKNFPDVPLMADANSAYTLNDLEHLKRLDEFHLMMIEQPLGHDDIVDHAKLQAEINTPVCLDESIHSFDDVRKAHELGSCKIINLKIGRVGGLTEAKRIHDYCKENGISLWCGGMLEAGVGRAHNIALATLPQFTLPGDTSSSSRYWEKDIIEPEVVAENGVIHVPEKPGIGYRLDEEAMDSYTEWIKIYHF